MDANVVTIKSGEQLRGLLGARLVPNNDWLVLFVGDDLGCTRVAAGAILIGLPGALVISSVEMRDARHKRGIAYVTVWAIPQKTTPHFLDFIREWTKLSGLPLSEEDADKDIFLIVQPGAPDWVGDMGASFLEWIRTGKDGVFHDNAL